MLGGRVAILFLEVARRSPWCRGTPAHVHWSLLRCPRGAAAASASLRSSASRRFVSPERRQERTRHPLSLYLLLRRVARFSSLPSLCTTKLPTSSPPTPPPRRDSTTFPFVPAAPSGQHRRSVEAETLPPSLSPSFPCVCVCVYSRSLLVLPPQPLLSHRPSSSALFPPPTTATTEIPPVPHRRRAILSLRFTRDLSAFINYIATERCVSLLQAWPAWLAALTAATSLVYTPYTPRLARRPPAPARARAPSQGSLYRVCARPATA